MYCVVLIVRYGMGNILCEDYLLFTPSTNYHANGLCSLISNSLFLCICRSVVVSAGLLRVFGREVAELPLVATSREYQGKV